MHHQHMQHDGALVLLSFAVALFASYTALDMGTRLRLAAGRARAFWLGGSAVVLGGGIWSMHFVAMLACDVGAPVGYDFGLTALSLLLAIAIVAIGLQLVTRTRPSMIRQVAAGCVVGCGVAAMHYTGMSALIVSGAIHYDPALVAASVLVAIIASTAALWLTLNLTSSWQRAAAAVVMAVAVCGMHYTAMFATSITLSPGGLIAVDPLSRIILVAAVSIGLFLILCLAMVCVFMDRRFELLAEREAEGLRASNLLLRGEIVEREAIALQLRSSNAALTDMQGAIRSLLDNADQGFLTVGADLVIGEQSSAVCGVILGFPPAGRPVIDTLYGNGRGQDESAVRATLESIFRPSSDFIRDLKLGLLPTVSQFGGKTIRIGYKYLADNGRLMMILTDVTQTVLLTEAVERERLRLEMIVLAVTEGEAFAALVNDYRQFLKEELPCLLTAMGGSGEILRHVHTYKGLLGQFCFQESPGCLHALETQFSAGAVQADESALAALDSKLSAAFDRDLMRVSDVLGADFASPGRRIVLSQQRLQTMENAARALLAGKEGRDAPPPVRLLLQALAGLSMLDVKAALNLHGRGAPALATRLGRDLAAVCIEGDEVSLPPEQVGDFLRSLVHVFRNAVDHGLEAPEDRVRAGKPSAGAIACTVRDHGDRVEIAIADDGAGVDRSVLEDKMVAAGAVRAQVERLALADLVFREGLSSRRSAGDISGRGIGLAVVKTELDRLGGSVEVESEQGVGTRFCFTLPSGRPAMPISKLEKRVAP